MIMPKRDPWTGDFPILPTGGFPATSAAIESLQADNAALKKAGSELAAAALRVVSDYDGLHRLMLATAAWAKAIADEGGRGATHAPMGSEPQNRSIPK